MKLIPVVVTAAVTSVCTLAAVSYFQPQGPHFGMATSQHAPVNYTLTGNSATAAAGPVNFENAAESSVKAVVHINTSTEGRVIEDDRDMNDVFSQFFGRRQYYMPPQKGSGSGVVISPDGFVVTNNHVVANASEVTITFNDRYTAKAKVVGTDPSTDIAVLKVEGEKNMPFMEFGNSDDVKLGQWVLAVGYPLSLDATVTAGIVSAKGRSLGINKQQSVSAIESFIQTDAAVNPGNSGGALVSTSGQLIGINSAIASPTGSYAGYSYAIPANIVRKAVNDLMKYGSVQRGYMGIQYVDSKTVSPEEMAAAGLDKTEGVYVVSVLPNSGAAKAGLKKGDIITQINGVNVTTQPELQGQIARYQPGDNVSVVYFRAGKSLTSSVQLTNLNGSTDIIKAQSPAKLLGATFRPLTDKERSNYNIPGGLMVTEVGKGAFSKQTNMQKGFVIMGINDQAINSINDLQTALAGKKTVQVAGTYPGRQGMYYFALNNIDGMKIEE